MVKRQDIERYENKGISNTKLEQMVPGNPLINQ